jgi:hypothetical protein
MEGWNAEEEPIFDKVVARGVSGIGGASKKIYVTIS